MAEQEAKSLTERLTRVWVVEDCPSSPTFAFETSGFRFCCELSPGVLLTVLGAGIPEGTLAAVGHVRSALLEGCRCELSYREGKLHTFLPSSAEPEEWEQIHAFVARWTPFFRRGCFLSELPLQHSAGEKQDWLRSFHERGDTMKRFDFESRRSAAAFGIKGYDLELNLHWAQGRGHIGPCFVEWNLTAPEGELTDLACGDEEDRWFGFQHQNEWQWKIGEQYLELMAKGLYRLGVEKNEALGELPEFTAHEKLELRLSMPREFWPKMWQDEASGT